MARFRLIDCKIMTVNKPGTSNNGKKYLLANMSNLNCPRAVSPRYTSFYEPYVNQMAQYISVANGGLQATEQPIPDDLSIVTGAFIEYTPATSFHKKHLNDHPEKGIKAGDLVSIDGIPRTYDKLIVFCEYYMDELNIKSWLPGGSPVEAGERAFGNYCVPVSTSATPAVTPNEHIDFAAHVEPPTAGLPPANPGMRWAEVNGQMMQIPIQQ